MRTRKAYEMKSASLLADSFFDKYSNKIIVRINNGKCDVTLQGDNDILCSYVREFFASFDFVSRVYNKKYDLTTLNFTL